MDWIFFSLLAPFFWATSNFVDKYILGKQTKGIFDFLFFSTVGSWLLFLILFIFVGIPELTAYSWVPIFAGVILIYSYGFYGTALKGGDTSTLVLLFELIPVLTVIFAFIFLGQTLSSSELIGFVVVLLGATVVSFEKGRSVFVRGRGMILVAIVLWAVMTLFIDYGLTKMFFWDFILLDTLGSALAGLTLLVIPEMRRQVVLGLKTATTDKFFWFFGNDLLDFFGQMSFTKALAIAPSAGLVTVLMQVQSFYAIVIGILLTLCVPNILREDISAGILVKKFVGGLIMFGGVYILLI